MSRTGRPFATLSPGLRLLVLGLFALSLLVRPVLTTFGEVHELAHAGAASHETHVGAADDVGDTRQAGEDPTLHTLLHLAHCCGQSTPVPAPLVAALPHAPPASSPRAANYDAPATTPADTPFRPPIAA
ncbi:hypothetical protein [Marilutibacter aestuarii]|uniref:DUF2946 domain-containing protein n=1 Tax=Marilutibacter aestuarii TaxID=1706195 RepID=A0A507ZXD4_9GAMM|nr:hypothetical protein [Lysobacter aestuarii]TQD42169.1 hypothetical protein FKV25_11895 [Lysobacter aestuarii]